MQDPIYLDNLATTPIDPRVLEAMMPFMASKFGNPSSNHSHGWAAKEAVEESRLAVADLAGADPDEIIFTSGATEANNMPIFGTKSKRVIVSVLEHASVLNAARRIPHSKRIYSDPHGVITNFHNCLWHPFGVDLVSVMSANNEVGSLQPLDEIARLKREGRFLFHSDMAQTFGKMPVDVKSLELDFASFSAHKMYGPKGVGALFVSKRARSNLSSLLCGGKQEEGLRPGTMNVPAIVGFGEACRIAKAEMADESTRIESLRNRLQQNLKTAIPKLRVNGHPERRIPGCLSVSFPSCDMTMFIAQLESKVSLSTGSACAGFSGKSHVLEAMGVLEERMRTTIRMGIGRFTTAQEIDFATEAIVSCFKASAK